MRHRLLNVLTLLSLLLCVAMAALWVRSQGRGDDWRWGIGRPYGVFHIVAGASRGRLGVGWLKETLLDPDDPDPRRRRRLTAQHLWVIHDGPGDPRFAPDGFWGRLGFDRTAFSSRERTASGRPALLEYKTVGAPFWLPCCVAIPPLVWCASRRRRRYRLRNRLCTNCGYDLRATSQRCPECGREPPAAPPTPAAWNSSGRAAADRQS